MTIDMMYKISLSAILVLPVFILLCVYLSGDTGRKRIGKASLVFLGAGTSKSKTYLLWRIVVALVLFLFLFAKLARMFR